MQCFLMALMNASELPRRVVRGVHRPHCVFHATYWSQTIHYIDHFTGGSEIFQLKEGKMCEPHESQTEKRF